MSWFSVETRLSNDCKTLRISESYSDSDLIYDLPPIDTFSPLRFVYIQSQKDYQVRLDQLSELLNLADIMNQPTRTLSLGQRIRFEISATLLHRPKIVYLDEPTVGLDTEAKREFRRFIQQINRDEGTTVVSTTHDLSDVRRLCKRVIV